MGTMSDEPQDNQIEEQFGDVIGPLGRLARAVDGQRYPGLAWATARRRASRRRLLVLIPTGAAAAAVVVAAAWLAPGPAAPGARTEPVAAAGRQEGDSAWPIPTQLDVGVAAEIAWELPSIAMPSFSDPNVPDWSVPSVSFPSLVEEMSDPQGPDPRTGATQPTSALPNRPYLQTHIEATAAKENRA